MCSLSSGHVTKSNVNFGLNKSIMRPHQPGLVNGFKGGTVIQASQSEFFEVDLG